MPPAAACLTWEGRRSAVVAEENALGSARLLRTVPIKVHCRHVPLRLIEQNRSVAGQKQHQPVFGVHDFGRQPGASCTRCGRCWRSCPGTWISPSSVVLPSDGRESSYTAFFGLFNVFICIAGQLRLR